MISTVSMEGVHVEMHVLRLTLDYVRKDRRDRAYVMEDVQNAQVGELHRGSSHIITYSGLISYCFP